MTDQEFKIALELANYILSDDGELRDFQDNPSTNHVYYRALSFIYDDEQIISELKELDITIGELK